MLRSIVPTFALLLNGTVLHAQWAAGGIFSTTLHFQASAFHTVDTGLFVYGANNPGPTSSATEGGIIRTDNGDASGGYYIWYEPGCNIEDIDVKVVNGFPYYMAAGHQQYAWSIVVKQYLAFWNPFQFDSVRTGSSRYYRAIRMRTDLVAFAAGADYLGNGIIDMSIDTGQTWTQIATLPGQPVSRLHFVNDTLGFAATGGYRRLISNGIFIPDSGAVYRTIDGGLNWSQVFADTLTGFSDVAFSSTLNGAATRNDGAILFTTDGGTTWAPATVNLGATVVMTAVTFRQDGIGFAAGYRTDGVSGYILISYDDGQNWYENFNTSGLNSARRIYDLYFHDAAHGYASAQIRPLRTTGIVTEAPELHGTISTLFPNPATEAVTVRTDMGAGARVDLIDATGRVLWSARSSGREIVLPLVDIAPGSYLVRLADGARIDLLRLLRP